MDEHTAIGARMLERLPFLAPVAPLVRSAHERHDGGGCPDGLGGAEIPRGAMVIAACDAFHAMTSDRSHRATARLRRSYFRALGEQKYERTAAVRRGPRR